MTGDLRALFAASGTSHEVTDVGANCDGSYAATGVFENMVGFAGEGGKLVSVSGSMSPENPLWIAGFAPGGAARFVRAIATGQADGSGIQPRLASFPDGSLALGGTFGTSATFGAGEAGEIKLQAMSNHPEGYVARFAASGDVQWVQHIGPGLDNYVAAVAAGREGVTYAFITSQHGYVVDKAGLNLALAAGEGALVALSAKGEFMHGVRFSSKVRGDVAIAPLSDGGVTLVAPFDDGAVLDVGGPKPQTLKTAATALFSARFSGELALSSVHTKLPATSTYSTGLVADGSVIVSASLVDTLTLGAGEPNEAKFTNADSATDAVLARYTSDGALSWATQVASSADMVLHPLVSLPDGTTWAVVAYNDLKAPKGASIVLGPGTAGEVKLDAGDSTGAVLRVSADGSPAWGTLLGADELLQVVAGAASSSSVILGGDFTGTVSFGKPPQSLSAKTAAGIHSAFLAEFGP
jgi:hypothetical protein